MIICAIYVLTSQYIGIIAIIKSINNKNSGKNNKGKRCQEMTLSDVSRA